MTRLFTAVIFCALAGCSSSGGAGISAGSIAKGATEEAVAVNKNSFMTTTDTYKIALQHCLKFEKTPKLVREASALDFWMRDKYACVNAGK